MSTSPFLQVFNAEACTDLREPICAYFLYEKRLSSGCWARNDYQVLYTTSHSQYSPFVPEQRPGKCQVLPR